MDFSTYLNNYLKELNCQAKELATASKLSPSTISRYLNGTRIPLNPSTQLDKLITGLATIAKQNNIKKINANNIKEKFDIVLKKYNFDQIINNFNTLVSVLKININEFSKSLGFDASYLSKIRSGKRKPADINMFFEAITSYIVNNYQDDDDLKLLATIFNCKKEQLITTNSYQEQLETWLCSNYIREDITNNIEHFLQKLNEFDLNEYIRVIHFNDLKVPTIPFKIPKSKNYYGLEEMKQGELDFLKSTVLSKSKGDVFMCSDMQMDDMSKDLEFGKKWMFGIAMMLKKGLHLNVIHNLDRPFKEMMIGLESWIPIYMTGQVSPFFLPSNSNSIYSHLNYVSNDVAITGECIKGYHGKGKYYLTNNKTEVSYYKENATILLKKAHPLMQICTSKNNHDLETFLNKNSKLNGTRKIISSTLPIYTISKELVLDILKRNKISKEEQEQILLFIKKEKTRVNSLIKTNEVQETIQKITEKEFKEYPSNMDLSRLFYSKKITYTYQEYIRHYNDTLNFAKENKNYKLINNKDNTFRNIQIYIQQDKVVLISKLDYPAIHFIIEHPKLCKSIENFIAPIIDK